jgi:acetylornithine deacetylase/succinyl-diaminopimelate desuccinylase-like protein
MAGSGPIYQLCTAYGVPTAQFGVGWANSRNHAPNESIKVSDFLTGIKAVGRLFHIFATLDVKGATATQ